MLDKTLILNIGIPRSGKSTWTRDYIQHRTGIVVVNPDSIRLALHGKPFLEEREVEVWHIARTMVRALFLAGHSEVILDACSHTHKRRKAWLSPEWECRYKCFDTSKVLCIERALANAQEYLIPVIERMSREITFPTENLYEITE